VVIIADRASRAGMVAKVMDEVRAGGIKDVAIAADTDTGG
jgi:biopolymer transport protein ExbD